MIPGDAYISAYYGLGICKICGQEKELRLGWCFDCFEKGLYMKGENGCGEN